MNEKWEAAASFGAAAFLFCRYSDKALALLHGLGYNKKNIERWRGRREKLQEGLHPGGTFDRRGDYCSFGGNSNSCPLKSTGKIKTRRRYAYSQKYRVSIDNGSQ